jgi:hypothetical protein
VTRDHQATESLQGRLGAELARCAADLRAASFPTSLCDALHASGRQIREPFTLAVVGLVKAGKSSLVNSLLGINLPTVGATETTATVNVFRTLEDTSGDVRIFVCRRDTQLRERVSIDFLEQLQGDSEEVLRRVAEIDHIEFLVPGNQLLTGVTLIDTPGLEAVSGTHQDTTASLLGLASQLRRRNIASTASLAREADGIVYVMHYEPRESDRHFLEEFHQSTRPDDHTRSTIAVVGRSDFDRDANQWALHAQKIQDSFGNVVLKTIPTSVEMFLFAQRLSVTPTIRAAFHRFCTALNDYDFDSLLNERRFRHDENPAIPLGDRLALAAGIEEWTAFQAAATFVRKINTVGEGDVVAKLREMAGIDSLKMIIQKEMIEVGPLLRCRRIAWDAESLTDREGKAYLRQEGNCDEEELRTANRLRQFLDRITPTVLPQDRSVVADLAKFIQSRSITNRASTARQHLASVQRRIATIRRECDFQLKRVVCLRALEKFKTELQPEQYSELCALFEITDAYRSDPVGGRMTFVQAMDRKKFWQEAHHPSHDLRRVFMAAVQEYEQYLASRVEVRASAAVTRSD